MRFASHLTYKITIVWDPLQATYKETTMAIPENKDVVRNDASTRAAAGRDELVRDDDVVESRDTNPDPITGAPGSHPVGTGIGAATAGAAGAAIGSVVPGIGTAIGGAVGAVVGAVAGGYAGKGIAEAIDPTAEEAYWRDEHRNRPYYKADYSYEDDYLPAYRYGYGSSETGDENSLRSGWESSRGKSRLTWDEAKLAVRDAWDRRGRSSGSGRTNS
jgi:outer membrane lipoprotein SlyB